MQLNYKDMILGRLQWAAGPSSPPLIKQAVAIATTKDNCSPRWQLAIMVTVTAPFKSEPHLENKINEKNSSSLHVVTTISVFVLFLLAVYSRASYLSSERTPARHADRWGLLKSRLREPRGASWEGRGCGEPCWGRGRSGRGCCCSWDGVLRGDCCRWQPEARQGSSGPSARTRKGTGTSCTCVGGGRGGGELDLMLNSMC